MVKKNMKKLVAVLLSAVMIATSIPFTAITAFAVDEETIMKPQSVIYAEQVVTNYTTKMDGSYFTNMKAAYDSYVKLSALLDRFDVTGDETGITAAADQLNNDLRNMGTFVSKQGSAYGKMQNDTDNTSVAEYQGVYKNLLYAEPQVNAHKANSNVVWFNGSSGNNAGVSVFASYGESVLLYDGITEPQVPVVGCFNAQSKGTWNIKNVFDTALSMTAKDGLYLPGKWHGYDTRDRNFQWVWYAKGEYLPTTNDGSVSNRHAAGTALWSSTYADLGYANIIKYNGDFASGTYVKHLAPTFHGYFKNDQKSLSSGDFTSSNKNLHVVNYKSLLDAMRSNKDQILLKGSAKSYKQGGMASAINAYNSAMALDPTAYNFSSNPSGVAETLGNDIKTQVDKLNSTKAVEDGTGYADLKEAINKAKNDYTIGTEDPESTLAYPDGAWDAFVSSYEDALDVFANLPTTGYNGDAAAKSLAETLNYNKSQLVAVARVDVTRLEYAIENAQAVVDAEAYFTADSFAAANAEALLKAAKIAVWGAEANYGVSAKLPQDSAASQALVAAQIDILTTALHKLVINRNAVTMATGMSYNTAVAEAQVYLAKAGDYSNIGDLSDAIADATAYVNGDTSVDAAIENSAHVKIEAYAAAVNAIVYAIQNLHPSFSKITDGTFANVGTGVSTSVNSSRAPHWYLTFNRNTDIIIFKTTHDARTYDLPNANFQFYNDQGWDAMLDSINMNCDPDLPSGEIVSNTGGDPTLSGSTAQMYYGNFEVSNGGMTLTYHDFTHSGHTGSSSQLAWGLEGEQIPYSSTQPLDDLLLTCQGNKTGAVTAKSGTVNMTAKMTVDSKKTSSQLFTYTDASETEIDGLYGTIKKTKFDTTAATGESTSWIGMTYFWHYRPFLEYSGYSYDRAVYEQKITIIDIASLLDLINYCETLDATQYSNSSFAAFRTALTAAKDEMAYNSMEADDIYEACNTRLHNLFDAMMALEAPANNNAIKTIIEQTTNVYRNDKANCEPTTWATFEAAYEALSQQYNGGIYSDKNVRDYGIGDQAIVDAAAEPLREAYNNLVRYADFSIIKNAIYLTSATIDPKKYNASQMDALKEAIATYSNADWFTFYMANKDVVDTYLNSGSVLDEAVIAQMHTFYNSSNANFADSQADITAVANSIKSVVDDLEESTIDDSALQAAIANIYANFQDPDAVDGVDDAIEAIRGMNLYTKYSLYGAEVTIVAYEDQDALDAAVAEILSNTVSTMKYDVKLQRANGTIVDLGKFDYGTKVYISADGTISTEKGDYDAQPMLDWYYSYQSNTSKNSEKFVSCDKYLAFIVKGNTLVRAEDASDYNNKIRVNYVNGLNGATYRIDYVEPGTVVTPNEYPSCHNYSFVEYTVAGQAVSSVTVDKETTIIAKYKYTETADTYTVKFLNLGASPKAAKPYVMAGLGYNDLLTIDSMNRGDSAYPETTVMINKTVGLNKAEAINTTITKRAAPTAANRLAIKYWAVVDADKADAWYDAMFNAASTFAKVLEADTTKALRDSLRIIAVGSKFNYRVHEDAVVIPLTEADYAAFKAGTGSSATTAADFVVGQDANDATVYASNKVIMNDGGASFSIVSNFTLPAGATMIETGILFQSFGDACTPDEPTALKLSTVGTVDTCEHGKSATVARMKSTVHTAGNQYVITIGSSKLSGEVQLRYAAYMVYELSNGTRVTVEQPTVETVELFN